MKGTKKILLLILAVLCSCSLDKVTDSSSFIDNSSNNGVSNDSTISDSNSSGFLIDNSSTDTNSTTSDSSSSSSQEIPKKDVIIKSNPTENDINPNDEMITLSYQTYSKIGSYGTGNYSNRYSSSEVTRINSVEFEHYRAIKANYNELMTLLPYYENADDGTIPGAIYNATKLKGITRMFINYYTLDVDNDAFKLNFGDTLETNYYVTLPASEENNYVEIDFNGNDVNYFKIETIDKRVTFKDITIYYTNETSTISNGYNSSGDENYRINPIRYTDLNNLIDGVSSVDLPIKYVVNNDGSYTITQTKTYTYYSYSYIEEHPEFADDAAMVEPYDVANYYIAFNQYPANYFSSAKNATKGAAWDLFGNKIRQVSGYSRTDGYVQSIPYNKTGLYYLEFDIDIGNTYINDFKSVTRGVGRVVIFTNGFTYDGYDNSPVAVFTDDHYSTFQEYLNLGSFGKRFNVQSRRTDCVWGSATIL